MIFGHITALVLLATFAICVPFANTENQVHSDNNPTPTTSPDVKNNHGLCLYCGHKCAVASWCQYSNETRSFSKVTKSFRSCCRDNQYGLTKLFGSSDSGESTCDIKQSDNKEDDMCYKCGKQCYPYCTCHQWEQFATCCEQSGVRLHGKSKCDDPNLPLSQKPCYCDYSFPDVPCKPYH